MKNNCHFFLYIPICLNLNAAMPRHVVVLYDPLHSNMSQFKLRQRARIMSRAYAFTFQYVSI